MRRLEIKTKILNRTVFLAVMLSLFFASFAPARAEDQDFLKQGIEFYQKADFAKAIDAFSQALIKDRFNEPAREYLVQMAVSENPRLSKHKIKLMRARELFDYLAFLEKRKTNLNNRNQFLKAFLLKYGREDELLVKSVELIEIELESAVEPGATRKIKRSESRQGTTMIGVLNAALIQEKERLAGEVSLLQKKYERFRNLKKKFNVLDPSLIKVSVDFKAMETTDTKIPDKKAKQAAQTQSSEINMLKKNVSLMQEEVGGLRTQVQETDSRIAKLTQEVAEKTLESMEKDQLITEQMQSFASLESELLEAQERLTLVQTIIKEKDESIGKLQEDLKKIESEATLKNKENQQNNEQFKAEMAQLQESMDLQTDIHNDKIAALEELIAEQEKKLAGYNIAFQKKEDKIYSLNTRILDKNKELLELNKVLYSKDEKLVELKGIIEIYKGKLMDSNRRLKEYVGEGGETNKLMSQFGLDIENMDFSDDVAQRLYERILSLEEKFTDEQK